MNPLCLKSAVVDALVCPHPVIEECTAMITVTPSNLGRMCVSVCASCNFADPYESLTIAEHFLFPFDANILETLDSFMYVVLIHSAVSQETESGTI